MFFFLGGQGFVGTELNAAGQVELGEIRRGQEQKASDSLGGLLQKGGTKLEGPSRTSYVAIHGSMLPLDNPFELQLTPAADMFLINVTGLDILVPAAPRSRHSRVTTISHATRPSATWAMLGIALLASERAPGLGTATALLAGVSECSGSNNDNYTEPARIVISMPRGLCFPEVVLDPLISCSDCAAWTCQNSTSNQQSGGARSTAEHSAAENIAWLHEIWNRQRRTNRTFVLEDNITCQGGNIQASDNLFTSGVPVTDIAEADMSNWTAVRTRKLARHPVYGGVAISNESDRLIGCQCPDPMMIHRSDDGMCTCSAGMNAIRDGNNTNTIERCGACPVAARCPQQIDGGCNFNFTGDGCDRCPTGYYQTELPEVDAPDAQCIRCPDSTFRSSNSSEECLYLGCTPRYRWTGSECSICEVPERCAGGSRCNFDFVSATRDDDAHCQSCPAGFYQTDVPTMADTADSRCMRCPTELVMFAEQSINTSETGWCDFLGCSEGHFMLRMHGTCDQCQFTTRCTGGNECALNFTGPFCSVCPPGYHQISADDDNPDGACEECPEATIGGYFLFSVGAVASAFLFLFLTLKGTKSASKLEEIEGIKDDIDQVREDVEELVGVIKTTISYLQVVVLLFGAEAFKTPKWVGDIGAAIRKYVYINIPEIFGSWVKIPPDCIVDTSGMSLEQIYWNRFLSAQMLFWTVSVLGIGLGLVYRPRNNRVSASGAPGKKKGTGCCGLKQLRPLLPGLSFEVPAPNAMAGTAYSVLFIALLSTVARGVDCNRDDVGVSRLDDFPMIECWTGESVKFQLVSLLMMLVYVLLWVVAVVMHHYRTAKDSDLHKDANTTFIDFFGRIYVTQETCDFAKKTALTLVLVFAGKNPWGTWVVLLITYIVYFVLSYKVSMSDGTLDKDEKVALTQALGEFAIAFSSFYYILYDPEGKKRVFVERVPVGEICTGTDDPDSAGSAETWYYLGWGLATAAAVCVFGVLYRAESDPLTDDMSRSPSGALWGLSGVPTNMFSTVPCAVLFVICFIFWVVTMVDGSTRETEFAVVFVICGILGLVGSCCMCCADDQQDNEGNTLLFYSLSDLTGGHVGIWLGQHLLGLDTRNRTRIVGDQHTLHTGFTTLDGWSSTAGLHSNRSCAGTLCSCARRGAARTVLSDHQRAGTLQLAVRDRDGRVHTVVRGQWEVL
eukprot:SAG22_NODE_265_length_13348_cov_150.719149_6_plen_1184_part_00